VDISAVVVAHNEAKGLEAALRTLEELVIAGLEGYGTFLRLAKLRSIWKKGEHIEPLPY